MIESGTSEAGDFPIRAVIGLLTAIVSLLTAWIKRKKIRTVLIVCQLPEEDPQRAKRRRTLKSAVIWCIAIIIAVPLLRIVAMIVGVDTIAGTRMNKLVATLGYLAVVAAVSSLIIHGLMLFVIERKLKNYIISLGIVMVGVVYLWFAAPVFMTYLKLMFGNESQYQEAWGDILGNDIE